MIAAGKEKGALRAIQELLILGRKLAREQVAHERLAALLDASECLAGLVASEEDCTERFQSYLIDTARCFSWQRLTDVFDGRV
jgi:hypothetical protein